MVVSPCVAGRCRRSAVPNDAGQPASSTNRKRQQRAGARCGCPRSARCRSAEVVPLPADPPQMGVHPPGHGESSVSPWTRDAGDGDRQQMGGRAGGASLPVGAQRRLTNHDRQAKGGSGIHGTNPGAVADHNGAGAGGATRLAPRCHPAVVPDDGGDESRGDDANAAPPDGGAAFCMMAPHCEQGIDGATTNALPLHCSVSASESSPWRGASMASASRNTANAAGNVAQCSGSPLHGSTIYPPWGSH